MKIAATPLKILILGCGGTGGYYGARLMQAAQAVTFLVKPNRATLLQQHGLIVQTPKDRFVLKAKTQVNATPDYDLVILTCKAYDLETAINAVAPSLKNEKAFILPLLNGVKHYDRLDDVFGVRRVLGGCVHINAEFDSNQGVVKQQTALNRITFGTRKGNDQEQATMLLNRLHVAFSTTTTVDTRLSEVVMQDVWEKYIFVSALAGMTCLARASVGVISHTSEGKELMLKMASECFAAAKHAGYPARPHAIQEITSRLTDAESPITASMLRDLESGKRVESDHLIGDMLHRLRHADVKADSVMLQTALMHLECYNRMRSAKI